MIEKKQRKISKVHLKSITIFFFFFLNKRKSFDIAVKDAVVKNKNNSCLSRKQL